MRACAEATIEAHYICSYMVMGACIEIDGVGGNLCPFFHEPAFGSNSGDPGGGKQLL